MQEYKGLNLIKLDLLANLEVIVNDGKIDIDITTGLQL